MNALTVVVLRSYDSKQNKTIIVRGAAQVRFMNYRGCRRKFDVDAFVARFADELPEVVGGGGAAAAAPKEGGSKKKRKKVSKQPRITAAFKGVSGGGAKKKAKTRL